ncbi:MAG TPA: hypothetical protein VMB48_13670 [Steroidobacteraceae bacterium]|nr:hypothetical protein [Steroidobacteraceae bacterium]
MPAVQRTPESPYELQRQRWLRDRAAARTLRGAFPAVARIRVDLKFEDATTRPPGAQSHAMHPPARAFFEFLCPHADCDGGFDLSGVATSVLTQSSARAEGMLECKGTRPSAGMTKRPCGVRVQYSILAQYHPADRRQK